MRTWILLGVFLGVFIIAFGIFVFKITPSPGVPPTTTDAAPVSGLQFTDTVKKGVHTIRGSAVAPTACTMLSAAVAAPAGTSTAIRVDLTVPRDEGICLTIPTTLSFSVSVGAPDTSPVQIYINNVLATTTP